MIENSSLAPQSVLKRKPFDFDRSLNTFAAWCLALLWLLPLLLAFPFWGISQLAPNNSVRFGFRSVGLFRLRAIPFPGSFRKATV